MKLQDLQKITGAVMDGKWSPIEAASILRPVYIPGPAETAKQEASAQVLSQMTDGRYSESEAIVKIQSIWDW